MPKVTDPAILAQLNATQPIRVTDPAILAQLNGDAQSSIQQEPVEMADIPWENVPGMALANAPASAGNFLKNTYQVVKHPIDTGAGLSAIARGGMQNMLPNTVANFLIEKGISPESRPEANAVADFYKDRYGNIEGFKRALATDPVGVAADISTLASGGAGLAKISGANRLVYPLTAAAKYTNPLTPAISGVKGLANLAGTITKPIIGLTTGSGSATMAAATEAGYKGGQVAADFADNMRGKVPIDESVLAPAKEALGKMAFERGTKYRSGMAAVEADTKQLPFNSIEKAVKDSLRIGVSRGGHIMNESAAGVQSKILKKVNEWKEGEPSIDHTAAGLDELKKAIGDVRDSSAFGTPERLVADRVYQSVRKEIIDQVPSYKIVMENYERSTKLKNEIEKALSLGDKASADTAIRKLQSLTRNNVNTNYGNRTALAKQLESYGADNLLTKVAGQSLNTWTPRGLQGAVATGVGGLSLYAHNPVLAASLLTQSPRLMGESAFAAGKIKRLSGKAINNKLSTALIKSAPAASTVGNSLQASRRNKQ